MNRKDFRPNDSSSKISDKDRTTIRNSKHDTVNDYVVESSSKGIFGSSNGNTFSNKSKALKYYNEELRKGKDVSLIRRTGTPSDVKESTIKHQDNTDNKIKIKEHKNKTQYVDATYTYKTIFGIRKSETDTIRKEDVPQWKRQIKNKTDDKKSIKITKSDYNG